MTTSTIPMKKSNMALIVTILLRPGRYRRLDLSIDRRDADHWLGRANCLGSIYLGLLYRSWGWRWFACPDRSVRVYSLVSR